jgi:type IV secretory pathway VirB6-like protein
MRKLIIITAALAFVSSTALSPVLAQDKAGSTAAPAATGGDTMSKDNMKKTTKKSKKSTKAKADDTTKQ